MKAALLALTLLSAGCQGPKAPAVGPADVPVYRPTQPISYPLPR